MILRLARPALLLIGFILLRPSGGVAQTKADSSGVQDTTKSFSKATIEHKKKDVKIFLEKIDIFGKIEKPQTVFIIQGKDPSIDDIQIDRSFFREMFRPVEKDDIHKISEEEKRTKKHTGR